MAADELVDLETAGWNALSTDAATAAGFYEQVLDESVVMLLPGGLTLSGRDTVLDAMSGQPWDSFGLEDLQVVRPTTDTGIVTYAVTARREGSAPYSALVSSLYVRRAEGWRLTFHQQTPR